MHPPRIESYVLLSMSAGGIRFPISVPTNVCGGWCWIEWFENEGGRNISYFLWERDLKRYLLYSRWRICSSRTSCIPPNPPSGLPIRTDCNRLHCCLLRPQLAPYQSACQPVRPEEAGFLKQLERMMYKLTAPRTYLNLTVIVEWLKFGSNNFQQNPTLFSEFCSVDFIPFDEWPQKMRRDENLLQYAEGSEDFYMQ